MNLAGFFVTSYICVHMVGYANKSDAPIHKVAMNVFFYQFHITGKSGLMFADYGIKKSCPGILYHLPKGRPITKAALVFIRVDLVDCKVIRGSVIYQ